MTTKISKALLSIVVTPCIGMGCGCDGSAWKQTELSADITERVHGSRPISPLKAPEVLDVAWTLELPDSLLDFFTMSMPRTVAVTAPPLCDVAVADIVDRAVHLFDADGSYRSSLFGGGRDNPLFGRLGLSQITSADSSTFIITTLFGRIITIDRTGTVRAIVQTQQPRPAMAPGNQVVASNGLYYDHWFAGTDASVPADDIRSDNGLLRVWDDQGKLLGRVGQVDNYAGKVMVHHLNRGIISLHADTIWFVRRADARVLAFPVGEFRSRPARVVELPVYYYADQPIQFVHSDGRAAVRIAEHVWASTIGPAGNFYIVQSVHWPPIDAQGIAFMPRTVLAILDRTGKTLAVYDLPSPAPWIAVTAEWIFVTQGQGGRLVIGAIRNPFFAGERNMDRLRCEAGNAARSNGSE